MTFTSDDRVCWYFKCSFVKIHIYKLTIDPKRPEPREVSYSENTKAYRSIIFPGNSELLKPNHFLVEIATFPIHRANWNPNTRYYHQHYFSQYNLKFEGFPTKNFYDGCRYSKDSGYSSICKAQVSQQFKNKYNKLNFLLGYRHLQYLNISEFSTHPTLKKEPLLNITNRIKESIESGECVICKNSTYNQSFLCFGHYNKNFIVAYESFVYLNNNGSIDETIEALETTSINQESKKTEEIVVNKEKFKYLDPKQLKEFSMKRNSLSETINNKMESLGTEDNSENKIENNFKQDYSRQTQNDYFDYSDYYY
ncbi:hypothetical protein DICPUDRAFT_98502 [Dictyostelium purpureum]|uniref:Uncharacterized protein n=1 Tax=Dictyostelium purpureum TaxID=5786 RepID=F0ZQX8_DICPU|nr:uncharacterized protein DICPUDRAFT_98502 [Dictyostelium purpureum]EGC33645.1 hypothetical protein DICPUDRAFT_98502 [Dictyostelium purpureum]|eukprot:XP_003289815.1 hypothetical protein DICPUDRAFT_98502 [Dictyostelium purpureum]